MVVSWLESELEKSYGVGVSVSVCIERYCKPLDRYGSLVQCSLWSWEGLWGGKNQPPRRIRPLYLTTKKVLI